MNSDIVFRGITVEGRQLSSAQLNALESQTRMRKAYEMFSNITNIFKLHENDDGEFDTQ